MSRRIDTIKGVWGTGLLFIIIGLVSISESVRLILYKDPSITYDTLGPGSYLLLLSTGLVVTGFFDTYHHWVKRRGSLANRNTNQKMSFRLIGSILVSVFYLVLISVLGYLLASLVFFILEFRIVGIKSWRYNFVLSVIITATYYFVFVKCCNLEFPKGFCFGKLWL